jgi:ATP-dependent 26S proteasome regulatory subunit
MSEEEQEDNEQSNDNKKIQFPQYFQKGGKDGSNTQRMKTPVIRGIVVSKFDGSRIWVEASGNMKGRYGVKVPSGFDPEQFQPGTEVALDPNSFKVIDILEKGKDAQFESEVPDVSFQDVGGLDNVIKNLRSNVGAQLNSKKRSKIREWGMDMDKSILLVGRPGTGKTHMVKALANEYDAEMFTINGPQLVEKFIGEGAKKVKRLYEQARESDKPAIVFIDEVDAVAKKRLDDRRHGGEEVERTMSQLLSELDGLDDTTGSNVISIMATNKPDVMDPALLNRCDPLEVPVPEEEAKKEIFQVHLRGIDTSEDLDLDQLSEEVEDDFTGRNIKQVVKQAAVESLETEEDVEDAEVTMDNLRSAVEKMEEGSIGTEKDFLADEKLPDEMFA